MSRYSRWKYPRYVSVGEKRVKAERKLKQLKKKNPHIKPIVIEGRTLSKTWWGKAWNTNLERYADYSNRIERGRSYVRHRAVLDLQIIPGRVTALVQGSRSRPYKVDIRIRGLGKKPWNAVTQACAGKFDSLQDLLAGKFPQSLADLFTAEGRGLFPTPGEIEFDCSCPDWAYMCKHVAAALYGIGARLDDDPALFFKLRKVKMADLVDETVQAATAHLLDKADQPSGRVIADSDLDDVFGIVMEDRLDFSGQNLPQADAPSEKRRAKIRAPKMSAPAALPSANDKNRILDLIRKSPEGIAVPALQTATGIDAVKIRNIIYTAYREGAIERVARGFYRGTTTPQNPADEIKTVLACIEQSDLGISVPEIQRQTRFPVHRVRTIVARAFRRNRIERIARGVYAHQKKPRPSRTATTTVLDIIRESPTGVSVAIMRTKTRFNGQKIANIVFRLKRAGKIKNVRQGVYRAALNRPR